MPFIIILGIIAFLLMEHAVIFWLVFVPLAILFVVFMVKWLNGTGFGVSDLVMAGIVAIIIVVALLIVCIP